ncbi:Helicase associated domain-containing protein [Asanoa hainanensis]|uniref:Helicase associated domain-containing protein n=1 Tax=Asanoa hainanensis TaxID=560556 RepID=A0A239PH07_9ACTN|nr:helicase associated domain-containing protein [Asanoa hainanensis]SNT65659.1 Helicase associated domain-containing protein [Asanoa hainanensis]
MRVLPSARCLNEGVDVPGVDGVLFDGKYTSVVNIIQAIGRALRAAEGKHLGYIILPVTLPADLDDDTGMSLSAFRHVWAVLRGLRAHDHRLAEELDDAVRAGLRHGGRRRTDAGRVEFLLPDGFDENAVQLRLVEEVGSGWEKFYTAALDWAQQNPGRRLAMTISHHSVGIGNWAEGQRRARTGGVLAAEQVHRLELIPGWYWDREQADWDDTFDLLTSYVDVYGSVADRTSGDSLFNKTISKGAKPWKLGVWLAVQRQTYRDGLLDPVRAARLEQLPGWDWTAGLRDIDIAMIQALRVFGTGSPWAAGSTPCAAPTSSARTCHLRCSTRSRPPPPRHQRRTAVAVGAGPHPLGGDLRRAAAVRGQRAATADWQGRRRDLRRHHRARSVGRQAAVPAPPR